MAKFLFVDPAIEAASAKGRALSLLMQNFESDLRGLVKQFKDQIEDWAVASNEDALKNKLGNLAAKYPGWTETDYLKMAALCMFLWNIRDDGA